MHGKLLQSALSNYWVYASREIQSEVDYESDYHLFELCLTFSQTLPLLHFAGARFDERTSGWHRDQVWAVPREPAAYGDRYWWWDEHWHTQTINQIIRLENTHQLPWRLLQVLQTSCGVLQVTFSIPSTLRSTRTWRSPWIITSLPPRTTPTWQGTSFCLSPGWKCTPTFSKQAVAV